MDEDFELPVPFKGEKLMLPARLLRFGYTYRIEVDIDVLKVSFEKDDEQNWRALLSAEALQQYPQHKVDVDLLQAIAAAIDDVLR